MSDIRPDPSKAFLGVGWAFPVTPDENAGDVARAVYEEDIRQAVLLILQTERGERVMRPTSAPAFARWCSSRSIRRPWRWRGTRSRRR